MTKTKVVDLFAGAGGFTTGAEMAGATVLAGANHNADAIATHAENHPNVTHLHANLLEMDPAMLPAHDLLVASPACQGFSYASQPTRRPKHEADRNTCWAVVSMAEAHRPPTILVENVANLERWILFPAWRSALEALGYVVRTHQFDTATFGVPQNRRRLIVTARQGQALDLVDPGLEPKPIGPLIDWGKGKWHPIGSKPTGVQRRNSRALERGLRGRYLLHYSSDNRGRRASRPIGTVTTKRQWAAVKGSRSQVTRMLSVDELRRAMGFPEDYALPGHQTLATRLLGNAIPPTFAAELVRQAVTR